MAAQCGIKHMLKVTDKHVFFYTEWPSNFCKTRFTWEKFGEKHEFFCTEQAFMWAKAKFFKDEDTAAKILAVSSGTRDPLTCKLLGREVKGYDDSSWDTVRYQMMLEPNIERFKQDRNLRSKISDPAFEGKVFVEASPFDGIWGIKLGMETPIEKLDNENLWQGRNLLGKVITEVREAIING